VKPDPPGAAQPPPALPLPAEAKTETLRVAGWPQEGQGISSAGSRWIFSKLLPQARQRYSKMGMLVPPFVVKIHSEIYMN